MGLRQTMQIIVEDAAKAALARDMGDAAKRGTQAMGDEVRKGGSAFDQLGSSVMGTLKGIATGMAAAFTVRAVVDFAKASIAEFQTVQRAWNEVRATVTQAGGDFDKMRDRIAKVSDDIADRFAFDDDEIRMGFTNLVRMTGDAEGSLKNLDVAAQIARAGNMSVADAATLLGKALETGNTRGLVPFIGALDKSRPIIDQVREKLGNIESTISPMERGTAALARGWDDVKAALGEVLVNGAEGSDLFTYLNQLIAQMIDWIKKNKDEIAAWVRTGIQFAVAGLKTLGNTVNEVVRIWNFFGSVLKGGVRIWHEVEIAFMGFVQQMLQQVLRIQNGMLAMSEALPGDPFAERIRSAIARTQGYISDLGVSIAHKSAEMKRDLGADDPQATQTTSLGGGLAANLKAGGEKGESSFDRLAGKGKAAVKELSDAHKAATDKMAADYADLVTASDYHTTQLQQMQANVQSAYIRTGDAAQQAGAAIEQATRDAIAAKANEVAAQQEVEGAWRGGEQYYVNQHVPAFLQGQEQMRAKSTEAATASKTSWLDAMNVLMGSLGNLANVAGGAFGSVVQSMTGVVSGISAMASGFKAFTSVAEGGITGLLGKIAGLAGGVTGVVGLLSSLPGLINAAGDLLGIKGSKDPGRLDTNEKLFNAARNGDQAALERLYTLSGASGRAGEGYGDLEGWGSLTAMQDAWEKYVAAGGTKPNYNRYLTGGATGTAPSTNSTSTTPATISQVGTAPTGTSGGDPRTTTTTTNPWNTGGTRAFQRGGLSTYEGPAWLHAPELVLPPDVTQRILQIASGGRAVSGPTDNSQRQFQVNITLHGIEDREVPRRVVEAVSDAFGRDFQRGAQLQGNALLPE